MTSRRAACNCGQLHLVCEGEPARVSMCHCLECQRRTGAVFGNQAWFERRQVTSVSGTSTQFRRSADSGKSSHLPVLPGLRLDRLLGGGSISGLIAVAVGSFADPAFAAPKHSVWERRRHHWVEALCDMPIQRVN